jgi:flagellar biosynthesis GTPase FlhF
MAGCVDLQGMRRTIANRLNYAHKTIAGLHGCFRFTGAAGVGKSATLIKVLVEWVLRNNARDVVVISTDNERLAGSESLQLACQMLSVPMRECSPGELSQTLLEVGSKTLVLVDSPAIELKKRMTAVPGLHDLWVCSALHGADNLIAQHRAMQTLRPLGVVVTQVDQMAAADALANLLYQWRLPLYWLGNSSHLPEGIDLAEPDTLYANLFGMPEPVALELAV